MSLPIVGDVLLISSLILIPTCSFWLWRNQDAHPIKGRIPSLILLYNVLLIVYFVNQAALVIWKLPCFLDVWFGFVFYVLCSGVYVYRAIRLLFLKEITKNLVESHFAQVSRRGWYVDHRHLMHPDVVRKIVSLLFFLYLIIPTTTTLLDYPKLGNTQFSCHDRSMTTFYLLAWGCAFWSFVHFLVLGIIVVKMRAHRDDVFALPKELNIVFIVTAFCFACYVGGLMAGTEWWWFWFWLQPPLWAAFFLSTVWPLKICWYWSRQEETCNQTLEFAEPSQGYDFSTLENLLLNDDGFAAYVAFLRQEFASELPLFWREVHKFKQNCQPYLQKLTRKPQNNSPSSIEEEKNMEARYYIFAQALRIWERFLSRGAPFEVNVPESTWNEMFGLIQNIRMGSGSPQTPEAPISSSNSASASASASADKLETTMIGSPFPVSPGESIGKVDRLETTGTITTIFKEGEGPDSSESVHMIDIPSTHFNHLAVLGRLEHLRSEDQRQMIVHAPQVPRTPQMARLKKPPKQIHIVRSRSEPLLLESSSSLSSTSTYRRSEGKIRSEREPLMFHRDDDEDSFMKKKEQDNKQRKKNLFGYQEEKTKRRGSIDDWDIESEIGERKSIIEMPTQLVPHQTPVASPIMGSSTTNSTEGIHAIVKMFDSAQALIYNQMKSDSYARFRRTSAFVSLATHFVASGTNTPRSPSQTSSRTHIESRINQVLSRAIVDASTLLDDHHSLIILDDQQKLAVEPGPQKSASTSISGTTIIFPSSTGTTAPNSEINEALPREPTRRPLMSLFIRDPSLAKQDSAEISRAETSRESSAQQSTASSHQTSAHSSMPASGQSSQHASIPTSPYMSRRSSLHGRLPFRVNGVGLSSSSSEEFL